MAAEVFVVIESNPRFGFARAKSESSGRELHTELYLEHPQWGGERLCPGDRVTGRVRGQSLHDPAFIERAEPPAETVAELEALRESLKRLGLEVPLSARELAGEQWRSRDVATGQGHASLREVLHPQLTFLFDWERAHPFEDEGLLRRLVEPLKPHVPELSVEAVTSGEQGPTAFRVRPGELELPAPAGTWEHPTPRYEGLVQALNALLERQGVPVRWTRLRDDWLLGPPELAELLLSRGLLAGPARADA
jgi:hypothetical protein